MAAALATNVELKRVAALLANAGLVTAVALLTNAALAMLVVLVIFVVLAMAVTLAMADSLAVCPVNGFGEVSRGFGQYESSKREKSNGMGSTKSQNNTASSDSPH